MEIYAGGRSEGKSSGTNGLASVLSSSGSQVGAVMTAPVGPLAAPPHLIKLNAN